MDNKTQQETKENKNEVVLDISYLINSREVVENGNIGIFTNADDFNGYVKSVTTISNAASMEMTTPKAIEVFGERKGKELSRRIGMIHVTQQLHNIYPIYNYDVLAQFRNSILEGIAYNLAIEQASPEVFDDVREQFINDEIRVCKAIYSCVDRILKSPLQRILLYKVRSSIKSYLEQLNIDLSVEEKAEEQQIKYDYPIETLNQLMGVISCVGCKDKYSMISDILKWYKRSKGGEAKLLAHIYEVFKRTPIKDFFEAFKSVGLAKSKSESGISNIKSESRIEENMLYDLEEIKKKHS